MTFHEVINCIARGGIVKRVINHGIDCLYMRINPAGRYAVLLGFQMYGNMRHPKPIVWNRKNFKLCLDDIRANDWEYVPQNWGPQWSSKVQ